MPPATAPRIAIIGGSLAGMMAAIALREAGCAVDVFERVPQRLEGHGAGLRIVPEMARLIGERAGIDLAAVSTYVRWFRHVGADNRIISEVEIPGQFSAWGSLHRALTACFGATHYHAGETCIDATQTRRGVTLHFAGGRHVSADLAVFADGILSTGRRLIAAGTPLTYAGYVGWRGFVSDQHTTEATRAVMEASVCYCTMPFSHVGMYPIPDPSNRDAAARFYNFVWYRNVAEGEELDALMTDRDGVRRPISLPAGGVREEFVEEMRADAARLLPPAGAEIVTKTAQPFLQALYDVETPRMVDRRICLIGDAAFATRPHAGAATAKAAINAFALADALTAAGGDIDAALAAWEPEQMRLGRAFVARNQAMGRRSLVENRYNPTDFDQMPGLYGPGR